MKPRYTLPHQTVDAESTFFTFIIEIARREQITNLTVVFTTPCASMANSSHSSESLKDIIREENIVDYDSDTVVEEGETPEPATSASCEPSRIAPNPFPERSTAQALTELRASTTLDEPIIINKLDEQQQRYFRKMIELDVCIRH